MEPQHGGQIEDFLDAVGPQHAGLAQHGVDGRLARRQRRGMGRRPSLTRGRAARLQHHHRHLPANMPGGADEAWRIGHRLEVKQHKLRGSVQAPVQEKVGHPDVGRVAHRNETPHPEAAGGHGLEHGQPEGARLGKHARVPRPGTFRPKVVLNRRAPEPLSMPVQLARPTGPRGPRPPRQRRLGGRPPGAGFRETGRDDTSRLDAERTALADHSGHERGGYADDDKVGHDRARNRIRVGNEALHPGMAPIDGENPPGGPAGDKVGEQHPGQGVRVGTGPHNSNCLRV